MGFSSHKFIISWTNLKTLNHANMPEWTFQFYIMKPGFWPLQSKKYLCALYAQQGFRSECVMLSLDKQDPRHLNADSKDWSDCTDARLICVLDIDDTFLLDLAQIFFTTIYTTNVYYSEYTCVSMCAYKSTHNKIKVLHKNYNTNIYCM